MKDLKVTVEQVNNILIFDWVVYESILHYLYGEDAVSQIDKLDALIYKSFMERMHNKTFLKTELKIAKLMEFIVVHYI